MLPALNFFIGAIFFISEVAHLREPPLLDREKRRCVCCLPVTRQSGKSISVDQKFFVYDNGQLKSVKYAEGN